MISLKENLAEVTQRTELVDKCYHTFLAFIAALCIYGAVTYWAMMMGITHNGQMQFDVAPNHWRMAGAALAFICPLTALGLWFRNAFGLWGWMLIAMIQISMHGFFPHLFGQNNIQLVIVSAIAVIFVLFKLYFIRREKVALNVEGPL